MNKIKQSLLIARCGLHETFTDTKMVILLLVIGFIYDNGARQMVEGAKQVGVPLGMTEAFIMCLNDWKYAILFLLGFMFLLVGVPRVNNEYIFFVQRAGKSIWLFGEVIHLFIAALLYTAMLLTVCIAGIATYSFIGNVWSDYVVDFEIKYRKIIGGKNTINASVFRYDYPYRTAVNAFCLMVLCLLVLGTIVLLFSIINKKTIGLILVVVLIGCMVIFSGYRIWWMWLIPTSHSVIALHHIYVFKKYMVPLPYSYLYLVGMEAVLIFVSWLLLRKKNYYK